MKKEIKYITPMFPYPSGSGLHIGHFYNYAIIDSYCRYWKYKGFDVFQPFGYICSDRSPVLLGYIRSTGITSRSIISKKGKNVDGVYHGNTLNGSVNH